MSSYSVFIPRVFSNIKDTRIIEIFHENIIGKVSSVDLVSRKNQKGDSTQYYNMAFVHFETLYNTREAELFHQDVANPDTTTKLVYEDPWFWLVLPFKQKDRTSTPAMENNSSGIETNLTPNVYNHSHEIAQQMTPFWAMTPNGPMWQWGYAYPEPVAPPPIYQKMVPPQVLYGNNSKRSIQRSAPKKRINLDNIFSTSQCAELQKPPLVRTTTTNYDCRDQMEEGEC